MKNTQMIYSPRTFKLGLGLILAAGLVSMPMLTGASIGEDAKSIAKAKTTNTDQELKAAGQAANKSTQSNHKPSNSKSLANNSKKPTNEQESESRETNEEARTRARLSKMESDAKKIASNLTPTQKTKLLSLLNEANSTELAIINGIGKSRSSAIEKARPIESIEALQEVKGVGPKTYADLIDHGKTLTTRRSSSKATNPAPTADKDKDKEKPSTPRA